MGTDPDTFAAVDAELVGYAGFATADSDGLSGTALNTVDAAHTQRLIQIYGMKKFIHGSHLLCVPLLRHMDNHCDSCPLAEDGVNIHLIGIFFHIRQTHSLSLIHI